MESDEWYFSANGSDQEGPVQLSHLRALLKSGVLSRTTLVWNVGLESWRAAEKVPQLEVMGDVPPPLPLPSLP